MLHGMSGGAHFCRIVCVLSNSSQLLRNNAAFRIGQTFIGLL